MNAWHQTASLVQAGLNWIDYIVVATAAFQLATIIARLDVPTTSILIFCTHSKAKLSDEMFASPRMIDHEGK